MTLTNLDIDIRDPHGFTLIELLVVIAIISLLSSIVLASLQTARAKARDSRRVQDLIQLRNVLELYATGHNGLYPDYVGGTAIPENRLSCWDCANGNTANYYNAATLNELITGEVISILPRDPLTPPSGFWPNDKGHYYKVSGSRRDYKLTFSELIENISNVPTSLEGQIFGSEANSISICTEDACSWSENHRCGSFDDENPDTVPSMC